ncbi:MAG: hypothetical protein U0R80_08205 [Nocardioidaceae bacterium]
MLQWLLLACAVLLGLAALLLALVLARTRRAAREDLAQARAETDQLRSRVAGIEERIAPRPHHEPTAVQEYVITDLGELPAGSDLDLVREAPGRIDGRLFADLVLRETVVKSAALAHGLRRALEPENRFRMRYTFRREVKQSRKRRRAELREARRLVARERRRRDAA